VPQGRSGQVRKISPLPGFDPRTVHVVAIPTELSRPSSARFLTQIRPLIRQRVCYAAYQTAKTADLEKHAECVQESCLIDETIIRITPNLTIRNTH
jgi:hypothetical protein